MKRINVETATREQLVDFIRRMHPQLQREQERVRELESQIIGFQEFIHEKKAEIRELRQQSDRLTEKSASDEETIGALIRQMEEMRLEPVPAPHAILNARSSSPNAPGRKAAEQGTGKGYLPSEGAGGERSPEVLRPADVPGNGEANRRPSRTPLVLKENLEGNVVSLKAQNAAATSTISSRADEIAKLEYKVRELMEVNAFYSAIVAQHDHEEKARMGQKLVRESEQSEENVAELRQELERLQLYISDLDAREEKLQQIIKATEAEKNVLRQENELLKRDSVLLEAEMEEMTRDYKRARRSLAATMSRNSSAAGIQLSYADDATSHLRTGSAPQQDLPRDVPSRGSASALDNFIPSADRRHASLSTSVAPRVSPLSYDGRQGVLAASGTSSASLATSSSASPSRFNFRSLRPIRVRNPDAHEKDLLDRIRLYEEQLAQMELFEADRQRSFDEMERNRAEMFAAMNGQLEKQRKEIHRLRKIHEASVDSSLTARPSRHHSVGSMLNREEEEGRAHLRPHGSHSPEDQCLTAVPTSTQSLLNVESLNGIDDADASFSERDTATMRSAHQRRGAATLASSGAPEWVEDMERREGEERLSLWLEAVEGTFQLFSLFHAVTVQFFTEELAMCHTKLLGERDELTLGLEDLQRRNEVLETQLKRLEFVLHQRAEEAEVDRNVTAAAELGRLGDAATDKIDTSSLESKTLCTAYLAIDAYEGVLEHYATLLRGRGLGGSREAEADDADDHVEDQVAVDLAEVQVVLSSLVQQQGGVLQTHPVSLLAASPAVTDAAEASHALPAASEALSTSGTHTHSRSEGGALCSSPSSSSVQLSSCDGPTPFTADQGRRAVATTASQSSDAEDVAVVSPPDVFAGNATTAAVSVGGSLSRSPDPELLPRSEYEAVLSTENSQATMTEHERVDDAAGEALQQQPADEADGTVTSYFADCVERDEGTGFTSASPEEGGDAKECSVAGAKTPHDVGQPTASSVDQEEPCEEEDNHFSAQAPQFLLQTEMRGVLRSTVEPRRAQEVADGRDAVEVLDSDVSDAMSAPSQLDVTAAEEAEFLAQLQEEMAKTEVHALPGTSETRTPHALSNNDSSSLTSDAGSHEAEVAMSTNSPPIERTERDETQPPAEAASHAVSTALLEKEAEQLKDVPLDDDAMEEKSAGSSLSAAGSAPSSSNYNGNGAHNAPPRLENNDAPPADAPVVFPARLSPSVSATSLSPDKSVADEAGEAECAPAPATNDFMAATAWPPPVVSSSMISPTSLDELFGGYSGASPHSPLPFDASLDFAAKPAIYLDPTQPPGLPPGPLTAGSPQAALSQQHSSIPTLSPNSIFATPPHPVPFRPFFTSPDGREGHSRSLSSSSEDQFEAGFDPFT